MRPRLPLVPLLLVAGLLPRAASAATTAPCQLGGPAGTASVVPLDLPHGSASLALRVTTTAPTPLPSTTSWHLATQVAVLRASDGRLVAQRTVQIGSSARAVVFSTAGVDERVPVPAQPAPFRHVAARVPPYLPAGRYLLVAFGTDGSTAVPNPGWSAEASFGTAVTCASTTIGADVLDRDQSDFGGGTQAGGVGAGIGTGAVATWATARRYVVGFADAETQLVGTARVVAAMPGGRSVVAQDALQAFAAGRGRYRFTADWTGAFPLVLVCAVAFTA